MISKVIEHLRNGNLPMAAVEATPTPLFVKIYEQSTGNRLNKDGGLWTLRTRQETWTLPRAKDALRITHIGDEPRQRVFLKYTSDNVKPQEGDTVVDVGAFIGEYSLGAWLTDKPDRIVAIEPNQRARKCCRRNLPIDIDVLDYAAHNTNGFGTIYDPQDPSDSGVLSPDADHYSLWTSRKVGKGTVRLRRLGDDLDHIDLLKIDAEGTEPEVLEGLGELRPDRISVDVSEERDGESTAGDVLGWLTANNYQVNFHDPVMFGWKK